jgi:hypothetical protein
MNTDIIDEIERYLSKYRVETTPQLKLKYLDETGPDDAVNSNFNVNSNSSFNKTWCKLGHPEKLNRLMRYLTKVQLKLNLDSTQTEFLRKFFYENVNGLLSSDQCVSYDPVEAEIITIIGLKCDGNNFYLHKPDAQPKPEGVRVRQRVFGNIGQLINSAVSAAYSPASVTTVTTSTPESTPASTPTQSPASTPTQSPAPSPAQSPESTPTSTAECSPPHKKTVVIKKK